MNTDFSEFINARKEQDDELAEFKQTENKIELLVKKTAQRQENDYDMMMVIDGKDVGVGKSNLLIALLIAYFNLLGVLLPPLKSLLYYRRKELDRVFFPKSIKGQLLKRRVIAMDEAINVIYKREFNQKKQIELIKLFDQIRYQQNLYILSIPNFWSLDLHFRNTCRVRYRLNVTERGKCHIWRPIYNPHAGDMWHQKHNQKHFSRPGQWYKSENYVDYFTFPDLKKTNPAVWKEYLDLQEYNKRLTFSRKGEEDDR